MESRHRVSSGIAGVERALGWLASAAALAILVVMLIPAEAWRSPPVDATYSGFDPSLVYARTDTGDPQRAGVRIQSESLKMHAAAGQNATVHLLTSPMSFTTSVDATVYGPLSSSALLQIGIWSPRSASGYFVTFGPPPANLITSRLVTDGRVSATLSPSAQGARAQVLGRYTPGAPYRLELTADRRRRRIAVRGGAAAGPDHPPYPRTFEAIVTEAEAPNLLGAHRLSLSATLSPKGGPAQATLERYRLVLPHQRWQVVKLADPRARTLTLALLTTAGTLLAARASVFIREARRRSRAGSPVGAPRGATDGQPAPSSAAIAAGAVVAAFLGFHALLLSLGSLPFDMLAARIWTHITSALGPAQLYFLPNTVTLAEVWNGTPYHEAVFPYHPAMAYYFSFVGWIARGIGPILATGAAVSTESVIKAMNVVVSLADAALIAAILRSLRLSRRAALTGAAVFLLNPSVWFSTSVWGQTHVVTLLPLLTAIWSAQRGWPVASWLSLAVCALTRPQALVPVALLAVAVARKFPLRTTIESLSWSVLAVFVALAPFSLAIGPSTPVDILANQIRVQELGGNEPVLSAVSLDAYNVWALVTRLRDGALGLDRFHRLSSGDLVAGITYQRASEVLVVACVLYTAWHVLRRSNGREPGGPLGLVALGTIGFLLLKAGLAAPHFVLGLPLLILALAPGPKATYAAVVGIWSTTTFIAMYGSFGFGISAVPHFAPALHHAANPFTRLAMGAHAWDWFITLATMANLAAFGWLAWQVLRGGRPEQAEAPWWPIPAAARLNLRR